MWYFYTKVTQDTVLTGYRTQYKHIDYQQKSTQLPVQQVPLEQGLHIMHNRQQLQSQLIGYTRKPHTLSYTSALIEYNRFSSFSVPLYTVKRHKQSQAIMLELFGCVWQNSHLLRNQRWCNHHCILPNYSHQTSSTGCFLVHCQQRGALFCQQTLMIIKEMIVCREMI